MVKLRAVLLCFALPLAAGSFAWPAHAASQGAPSANLEAFAGEYTDSADPGESYSFYVQDGKLTIESERWVPTVLKPAGAAIFAISGSDATVTFTLDSSGRGATVSFSEAPGTFYSRTGPPVHHVFHDYHAHRGHDSHARRGQAPRGDSEAR